ncbi:hypothetical protein ASG14_19175 [Pedobacter sp. Leaf194]|nr:hypothetical protein ASG14_19175 [Pedobacter sp. Leaf194]
MLPEVKVLCSQKGFPLPSGLGKPVPVVPKPACFRQHGQLPCPPVKQPMNSLWPFNFSLSALVFAYSAFQL